MLSIQALEKVRERQKCVAVFGTTAAVGWMELQEGGGADPEMHA